MRSILCVTKQLLLDPSTDLDETLGMYRVDPEIMQRHIFNFRSRLNNRKLEFSRKLHYIPMYYFSRDS